MVGGSFTSTASIQTGPVTENPSNRECRLGAERRGQIAREAEPEFRLDPVEVRGVRTSLILRIAP